MYMHIHVTIIIEEKETISYTCMEEIGRRIVSEAGWRKRRMENDVIPM